ncbi:MAG: transposase, partial [Synechococcus sp. SB0672_bin_10]|nr:transposase [Synechococcus sp. SB0672_bin_10]
MEVVVPFAALLRLVEPVYPRVGPQGGRPPYLLEVMLRIHLMQNWYPLSDAAMENELIDIACIRRFAGIDLFSDDIPDHHPGPPPLSGAAPVGREDLPGSRGAL